MKAILCWRDNYGREGRGKPISLTSAINHVRLMNAMHKGSLVYWYEVVESTAKKDKRPC